MAKTHGEQTAKGSELNIKINSIKFCKLTSAPKYVLPISFPFAREIFLEDLPYQGYMVY